MTMHQPLAIAGTLFLCAQGALAQAFNIDFGVERSVPSIEFPGASGSELAPPQPGYWVIPTTQGNVIEFPRVIDITNTRTEVTLRSSRPVQSQGAFNITGDENIVELIADGVLLGGASRLDDSNGSTLGPLTLTWTGLENGLYEVYTYTTPHLDLSAVMSVTINGITRVGGGPFPPVFFVEGVSHTRHVVRVEDGTMEMRYETVLGSGVINGLQIVPVDQTQILRPARPRAR